MAFSYDLNDGAEKQPEEEMSEGIRALLEITRNFKNLSKFEGIPNIRSQESVHNQQQQANVWSSSRLHLQPALPSTFWLIPPDPDVTAPAPALHQRPSIAAAPVAAPNNTNYAMAVKKTLETRKMQMPRIVCRRQSPVPPPAIKATQASQTTAATPSTEEEPKIWLDRNGRRTVNAKEMEGGPKINGCSIVNGIILKSLKFVKPARQCPKWDKPKHRMEEPHCQLWHPRERCQYFPKCRLTAEVCGFGHPFCGNAGDNVFCQCAPEKRSLQLNHLIKDKNAGAVKRAVG